MWFGCAHNWRGDERFMRHPGQRDLGSRHTALLCDLRHSVEHATIGFNCSVIEFLANFVCFDTMATLLPVPGQTPSCKRTPWNHPNSFRLAKGHHLPFFLTIEKVVVVLHADESGPTMKVCDI